MEAKEQNRKNHHRTTTKSPVKQKNPQKNNQIVKVQKPCGSFARTKKNENSTLFLTSQTHLATFSVEFDHVSLILEMFRTTIADGENLRRSGVLGNFFDEVKENITIFVVNGPIDGRSGLNKKSVDGSRVQQKRVCGT